MISITVSGPGEVINTEMHLLANVLISAGYTVEVHNDHPPKPEVDMDKRLTELYERWDKGESDYDKPIEIRLEAEHLPWGG